MAGAARIEERPFPWEVQRESILARRLPWLLVFRAVVATLLLVMALAADFLGWSLSRVTYILYAVNIATYFMVLVEGLLLRANRSAIVLSTVHLASAVGIALTVVQGTGGVSSAFSFLYLLAILDGAIIAGRGVALAMASICSLVYGGQLVLQLYKVFPVAGVETLPNPQEFVSAVVVHIGAFYLIAILAGHLAGLLEMARQIASSAKFDLQRVLELHAAVLESLPLGVVTVDSSGYINTANQAAAWILAIPITKLIGSEAPRILQDFIIGDENFATVNAFQEEKERQVSLSRSRVQRRLPGGQSSTKMDLTLVVMEDRTEWYSLERHMREKERLAGIGELAAAIAHEIRNPLASMSGSLELLDHPEFTTTDQRDKLRRIVSREVSQLNRLLENFLIYARPAPPRRFEVDVGVLVREVAEAVNQAAEYKEHDLVVQTIEELPALIDPEQIRQLLWNLLKNAFEASPTNDEVELKAGFETPDSKWIVLEVADRGPGIDPTIRKTMFDPFQTTKASGTGLGLSIVHRIVESHGGRIDVSSSEYGGALFRVILPSQPH